MKIKIYFLLIILWVALQAYAQKPNEIKNSEVEGFYITASDFSAGKLTLPTDNKHKGDKIKLNQFFISPDITVVEQGVEKKYPKDSIFAIKLVSGQLYRFINRNPCKVTDTSFLFIYAYETTKTEYEISGPRRRQKEVPVTYYYFSIQPHSKAFPLTMLNIRREMLKEPTLHTAVCNKFTSDNMLTETNPETGHFTINEFILAQKRNQ